jgi:hypothetical protein
MAIAYLLSVWFTELKSQLIASVPGKLRMVNIARANLIDRYQTKPEVAPAVAEVCVYVAFVCHCSLYD